MNLTKILKRKGLPYDFLSVKYKCDFCSDNGKLGNVLCRCARKMFQEEALVSLGSDCMLGSGSLKNASFEGFSLSFYSSEILYNKIKEIDIMRDVYNFCKDYAENFSLSSGSLLFVGETGLGKTHLSIAILKCVIKKGFNGVYVSSPNIVQLLRRNKFGNNEDSCLQNEVRLINCDLLVIDDLGTEFNNKFSISVIYNLVNSRMLKCLPTIISTNLYLKEIENNYNSGLVSRIIGNFKRLKFLGTDIRQFKVLNKSE